MLVNYILGEIIDFDKFFEEVRTDLEDFVTVGVVAGHIISSHTNETTYRYASIEHFDFSILEKAIAHESEGQRGILEQNPNVHKLILGPDFKLSGNEVQELLLIVYSRFETTQRMVGTFYVSCHRSDSEQLINYFNRPLRVTAIESTLALVQAKIDLYDKLYYSIDTFTEALAAKDRFMPFHMTNVANWCRKYSLEVDMDFGSTLILYVSALIHDVGKIHISEDIINKPGKLTAEEYSKIKDHSKKSYEIAKSELTGMDFFRTVPDIILHHHERYDGTGYPGSLEGEKIPYLSRIITVADSVDAMLSRRAYKSRMSKQLAIKELKDNKGTQFDPEIADVFIQILQDADNAPDVISVSDTSYLSQTSISFYYGDYNNMYTYTGNLVINKGIGKLMVHDDFDISAIEVKKIFKAKVSFYNMNNIVEYQVDVSSILGHQIILNSMIFTPLDNYFSLLWEVNCEAYILEDDYITYKIIKIGGDKLVLEASRDTYTHLIHTSRKAFRIKFKLAVEEDVESFDIYARVVQFYDFGKKQTFVLKYANMSNARRDLLIRYLFKKQLHERKESKN